MPLVELKGEYTFKTFIDKIKEHCSQTNDEIRILAYISDLEPNELFDSMKRFGFSIKKLGEIVEIQTNLNESNGNDFYYFHYNSEKNLLLCFTSETLEDARRNMDKFVHQKYKITNLWIHPLSFEKICRKIISENPNTIITEFHASRYRKEGEVVLRDSYQRYFKYMGDDGRYTLEEVSKSYGVLPTSIQFIVPELCKFRITDMGRFTFIHGDLDFLFSIINEILSNALKTKAIIDQAKTEFIPVNMGKKEIKLPKVIPLDIVFSREIDYYEIEQTINNMTGEGFNFEIFDMALIPGSIHLSGTILDRNKNLAFNITGSSNKITLSPRKDTSFDSMLQFYKMITEKLDLKATVAVLN